MTDVLEDTHRALTIACDTLENQAAEIRDLYDRLEEEAKRLARELAEMRIMEVQRDELWSTLEEVLDRCKDQYDVEDGDDGRPLPNEYMRIGNIIEDALGMSGRYK
jgi:predicted transcriptional regulator